MNEINHSAEQVRLAVLAVTGAMGQLPIAAAYRNCTKTPEMSIEPFNNACVESMAVNLRKLDEFFCTTCSSRPEGSLLRRPYQDDIFAEEFGFPARPFLSLEQRDRVNARLAHFTWRGLPGDYQQSHGELVSCYPTCVDFIDHLLAHNYLTTSDEPHYSEVKKLRAGMLDHFNKMQRHLGLPEKT